MWFSLYRSIVIVVGRFFIFPETIAFMYLYFVKSPKSEWVRLVITAAVGGLGALYAGYFISKFYYSPRPADVSSVVPYFTQAHLHDNGFPSTHVMYSTVLGALMWAKRERKAVYFYVSAVAVGSARVIGHVHRPIDVIGSLVIGTLVVHLVWVLVAQASRIFERANTLTYRLKPSSYVKK